MKAPISVCMIVRDEEKFIGPCLESIRPHVEEIVILDTGSVDRTLSIAKDYADRVEQDSSFLDEEGFIRDFSAAREASYSLATRPWHMWLDADDVVHSGEAFAPFVEFLEQKRHETGVVHVGQLRYLYTFNADGSCNQDFLRERLTPSDGGFKWVRAIHESLKSETPHVKVPATSAPLVIHHGQHKPRNERNIRILKRLAADPSNVDPMIPYYVGNSFALMGDFEESNRWLEQAISMPTSSGWKNVHPVRITAYKHLHRNALITNDIKAQVSIVKRFLDAHPKSASAYFCAAHTTLWRAEYAGDLLSATEVEASIGMIDHALTLNKDDDDIFYNPWEWHTWAPAARNTLDRILSKMKEG